MASIAQLWRTWDNAVPTWDWTVSSIDVAVPLAAYVRPGAFNDPDMLEIGNGSLAEGEQRVLLSIWSILSAPLLAGNDLSQMSDATRTILTNNEVIALDQDPLALQGALVRREGTIDVLAKPLVGCGARGVVLWNRGASAAEVTVTWPEIWLLPGAASVRDLWAHADLAPSTSGITLSVPSHDAVALRIVGAESPLPRGNVYLSDLPWTYAVSGYGPVERDTSNGEELPADGRGMRLRGRAYDKGIGVHGPSLIRYRLGKACSDFVADVGIDDETGGEGKVQFEVWADGIKLYESGVVTGTTPPARVNVDVRGKRDLRLFVGLGGGDFHSNHADWADARLFCDAPGATAR
jgi:alpha-galactosidase